MGWFQVLPNAVAVAADRLVAIVRVEVDGTVVIRDLANGRLNTAAELAIRQKTDGPKSPSKIDFIDAW